MTENHKNYHWLAGRMRDKVASEEWLPSDKIPTERALSAEFGVTRVTIRRALRVLEDERLIRRVQGSGTYVNPSQTRRIPLMIDYTGSIRNHAPEMKRRVIRNEKSSATDSIALELKINPGDKILYAERVDYNSEAAVAYDQVFIPEQFSANLADKELEKIDFLETWSEICAFQISFCRQNIEAILADAACRKNLKLKTGAPVLKSTEYYYADEKTIAGIFISYYHPEHICISSNYDWKTSKENVNA